MRDMVFVQYSAELLCRRIMDSPNLPNMVDCVHNNYPQVVPSHVDSWHGCTTCFDQWEEVEVSHVPVHWGSYYLLQCLEP